MSPTTTKRPSSGPSAATQKKALRYLQEGRIEPEHVGCTIESYRVASATSTRRYRTIVGPGFTMCNCQAPPLLCCHRIGAELLSRIRRDDPDRYRELVERVTNRLTRETVARARAARS